jgi:hypothetical protein
MGRKVKTGPDTVLNVSSGEDGMVVRVSKGTAEFSDGGQTREIGVGAMVSLDADGIERMEKAAVAIQPRPNARYLKNGTEPLHVDFTWNRINLDSGEPLRMEIAGDRNFKKIIKVIENITATAGGADAAESDLDAGVWYWRLSIKETGVSNRILTTERLMVTEAAGPPLLGPVKDSLFRYQDDNPQLRFQWEEVEGASSYILEVSETEDFINPRFRTRTDSVFVLDSSLGSGTWHWRVIPVFPSVYEGRAASSPAASFRIEQGGTDGVVMILPEPVIEQPMPTQTEPVVVQPPPRQSPPRQTTPRQPAPKQPEPVRELPLLPAPQNLQPPGNHRIGIEEIKTLTDMVFSWSAVRGANAYIFTLYDENPNGRRIIIQRPPENSTSWTLENFSTLGRGTFVWQVEAVNRSSTGTIDQRGRIGENSFIIDIPRPGQIQAEDPGTLYGF